MQSNYRTYDFERSRERIDEILNSSDNNYVDKKEIPERENLTFTNGYYIWGSAIFVDMRDSKGYSEKHTRPVLAKVYRSYISELVAVLNGLDTVREVYIEGDCVWAVYNTPLQSDVDNVFDVAAKANSLMATINVKLKKKNYSQIKAGIGVHYGETLMIKAGYKGSSINEVTWIGKLISKTAEYCSKANKGQRYPIILSDTFVSNLKTKYQEFCTKVTYTDFYGADVVDSEMNDWVMQNG